MLIRDEVMSDGSIDEAAVYVREVIRRAIDLGSSAIILVHNHPSGHPEPSPDDARLTLRLCAAADVLDLPLLDHLIVGDGHRYFSFSEAGLIGASREAR